MNQLALFQKKYFLQIFIILFFFSFVLTNCQTPNHSTPMAETSSPHKSESQKMESSRETLITNPKQLLFEGERSGEGYFNPDGSLMIFQSERAPGNPFYQMFLLDLKSGKTQRLSPGDGKATCGWIHPSNKKVLFSSTHLDPYIKEKKEKEFQSRLKGGKRYSWEFDDQYDIFQSDLSGRNLKRLTHKLGYDAEASYSPDGQKIIFASNFHAYEANLTADEKIKFTKDPSFFMELYEMDENGKNIKRLTHENGYDGGPFYSPDGKQIVWRKFNENGHIAELFIMNSDGTDKKQLTHLNQLSWAPFFHPSGDYIIFSTSLHGHDNFELYLIDTHAKQTPLRVTQRMGFDGLPVFTPDGDHLIWTSTATSNKLPQIFIGDWDDEKARTVLGLPKQHRLMMPLHLSSEIKENEIKKHIKYLASEQFEGRLTGSDSEKRYTEEISFFLKNLGLEPAGDDDSFLQRFEFSAGVSLGAQNHFELSGTEIPSLQIEKDWIPISFSAIGNFEPAPIVFAGYGLNIPATNKIKEYDSYSDLDVKNKWVMVFRFSPSQVSDEEHLYYNHFASLRNKAYVAREKGAKGIIFISGPESKVKNDLVPLKIDGVPDVLGAISISDAVAKVLFNKAHQNMAELQKRLDLGERIKGFVIPHTNAKAHIEINQVKKKGINILARLRNSKKNSDLIIGAHADHLGRGEIGGSLASSEEITQPHLGADDNASGVSALLELAHYFKKHPPLHHNLLFAIWSGEEIGMLGSSHFLKVQNKKKRYNHVAYINMDMIGRLKDQVIIQGVGSSQEWPKLIERARSNSNVTITTQNDPYLPTDTLAFYLNEIPSINFFTGAHKEYHTPKDSPETINFSGVAQIANLVASLIESMDSPKLKLDYKKIEKPTQIQGRFRIYLGTIPDYSQENIDGLKLTGVVEGGPAAKAGLIGGDVIIEFGGRKVHNIHDYTYALETARIGVETTIVVLRNQSPVTFHVIPISRE